MAHLGQDILLCMTIEMTLLAGDKMPLNSLVPWEAIARPLDGLEAPSWCVTRRRLELFILTLQCDGTCCTAKHLLSTGCFGVI
jgi:hypothetical protein